MSIRVIRTFVSIARHGSFSAAARSLGMTQSTVSLQMKALEEQMRTELFDRSGRRPTLNGPGRAFLEKAREVLQLYDELADVVSAYDEHAGILKFGAVNSVITGVLPSALRRLRGNYPRLQTQIVSGLSQDLVRKVDDGEIDAALVSAPPSELAPNLTWRPVMKEPLVVIAPSQASDCSEKELLETYPYIRFNKKAWAGRFIDQKLRENGYFLREIMELDSLEAVSAMVAVGMGVSVVPKRVSFDPLNDLVMTDFQGGDVYREIGIIMRSGSASIPMVNALYKSLTGSS